MTRATAIIADQRGKPDQARAVAVMRGRQRAEHGGIGEDGERDGGGEFADIGESVLRRNATNAMTGNSAMRAKRAAPAARLMAVKSMPVRCWRAACIAGTRRGRAVFDRVVGVPDPVDHAGAGVERDQLLGGFDERRFELQQRIVDQAGERDATHLVVEAVEAAELVEQRAAPEEVVGVVRQFVLVGAQPQVSGRGNGRRDIS